MLEKDTLRITTQYLNQNPEFIEGTPSNYIIFKRKPGLGATYGEIEYKGRNSIILEPNTPVLEGKRDALNQDGERLHPNILVVFKGIEKQQVSDYLNSDIMPKKILCTPEAYTYKVKPAISESSFNLYTDFFMLLDECDRIIKDVIYRNKISAPMRDFFEFKNKAMVSATALEPSDVRFRDHNFRILNLVPDNEQRQNMDLIQTNNILYSLAKSFKRIKSDQYFIFINSPMLALILIKRLNIEKKSKIYCSNKSLQTLRKENYNDGTDKLGDFVKYNFLTSRFFSAVDIILENKPDVIMITDILRRTFTMLDPYTDTIQIIGRFRKGVATATHITNFSNEMEWSTAAEALQLKQEEFKCYQDLKIAAERNNSTTGGRLTGQQALEATAIHNFIDSDTGTLNSFMIDNHLLEHKITRCYTNVDYLKEAYSETEYYTIRYWKEWYDLNDAALLILEKRSHTPESNKVIGTLLYKYQISRHEEFMRDPYATICKHGDTVDTIKKEYPEIVAIFDTIGFDKMEDLGFDTRKMTKESKKINELDNKDMIKEIKLLYIAGDKPTINMVGTDLKLIYTKYGIVKKATSTEIVKYYDAEKMNTKPRCWKIIGIKP